MRGWRSETSGLRWFVDRLARFHQHLHVTGWVEHDDGPVESAWVEHPRLPPRPVTFASCTVTAHGALDPPPRTGRFVVATNIGESVHADELVLVVDGPGGLDRLTGLSEPARLVDPFHQLANGFYRRLAERGTGRLVEIGSRSRASTWSGGPRAQVAQRLPPGWRYRGIDLVAGPNVDVVADVHELDRHLRPGSIDAVVAASTFEHLLMPWKAVLALNRVLGQDGLVLVSTHQSFPLHDLPFDLWRFADATWHALFNPASGFVVEDVAMGEPAAVVPLRAHGGVREAEHGQAFLGSAVIARKITPTRLRWEAAPRDVLPPGLADRYGRQPT